jgi:hypothetical protein
MHFMALRLCKCYRQLIARENNANKVVVAIARARRAFIRAIAQEVPLTLEPETVESSPSVLTTEATVVSSWLRLFRGTKDKRTKKMQNNR